MADLQSDDPILRGEKYNINLKPDLEGDPTHVHRQPEDGR